MARMPIPDDWDEVSWCCHIVQWPSSVRWNGILLGLLTWPTRGYFWDERTGTVTDAQAIGREILDVNTDGGCLMGCIEDLGSYLARIATALETGSGCCAPAGQTMGQYPPTGNEVSGGGTPPPGFTETEPDTSEKCALANWYYQQTKVVLYEIISVHLLDLLVISVVAAVSILLDVLALTAAAAWLALMTSELGSLSDLIEALLGADEADLQDILDALEADAEGAVCAMYSANSNGEAGDALEAWGTAAGLSALEVIILRSILTDYVLAGLFYAAEGALEAAAEVVDPINCAFACLPWEECGFALEYGSGTITYDGEEFTLSSETLGGYDELRINAPCMAGDCDEAGNWCIQVTAYDLDDSSASYSRTFVGKTSACASRTKEYQFESPSMCPLDTTLKLTTVTLTDQNPFTVTFKVLGRSGALGTSEYPDSYAGGCP